MLPADTTKPGPFACPGTEPDDETGGEPTECGAPTYWTTDAHGDQVLLCTAPECSFYKHAN